MANTVNRTASFFVDARLDEALDLFTPEGERAWVEHWSPVYSNPTRKDGPGAVFTTSDASGSMTYWVLLQMTKRLIRYVHVRPGVVTGTITVEIDPSDDPERTRVTVTHDLTASGRRGRQQLDDFGAGYERYIAGWELAIMTRTA